MSESKMAPYRSAKLEMDDAPARWPVTARTAARAIFAVLVLTTAVGAGALFVAWPTPVEPSHRSIHTVVRHPAEYVSDEQVQYSVRYIEATP